MKNKVKILFGFIAVIIMSFIGLYAGHFLLGEPGEKPPSIIEKPKHHPVVYRRISTRINGLKQEINVLEVDVGAPGVDIIPALSFDSVFGFEKLSTIASEKGAYAAVNAGFFYEYGQPSGMVAVDGRIITAATGNYPVFILKNGKASLEQVKPRIFLTADGKKIELNNINAPGGKNSILLYTREYGRDNRARNENFSVTIENGIITKSAKYKGKAEIPDEGMLLTLFKPYKYDINNFPFKIGDKVDVIYEPDIGDRFNGYECGSWIVKNGDIIIGERDPWIGVLSNRDPRTAIGIKNDGKVVLITVDGRQPGHSTGMTGEELGAFLKEYGVKDAAMLDGGASTEMVVKGKLVNRPSDRGEERPLGGGIIVKVDS